MSSRVVHFELPYRDPEVCAAFYTDVFDWRLWPVPELNYIGLSTGPTDREGFPAGRGYIGGSMVAAKTDTDRPVIVINVEDIDKTLAAVTKAGGAVVMEKTKVSDHGWSAYFSDPEGNILGLWQPGELG